MFHTSYAVETEDSPGRDDHTEVFDMSCPDFKCPETLTDIEVIHSSSSFRSHCDIINDNCSNHFFWMCERLSLRQRSSMLITNYVFSWKLKISFTLVHILKYCEIVGFIVQQQLLLATHGIYWAGNVGKQDAHETTPKRSTYCVY